MIIKIKRNLKIILREESEMAARSLQQMTNQEAFEKRKQITVKAVAEGRGEYDNNGDDDINNDVEDGYREGPEAGRR